MPIQPMNKPKALDGVDYNGVENCPLFVQGSRFWVHDPETRRRVMLDPKGLKPHPNSNRRWTYSPLKPKPNANSTFEVTLNLNGGVTTFKVEALSDKGAKARAVSRVARTLGYSEAHVYVLLKAGQNSISVKEYK